MNQLILKELNNCNVAILPDSFENCDQLTIPKGVRDVSKMHFEIGKYYKIHMQDYIVHPYEDFTLHSQWNNNVIPKDADMNIQVLEIMGKLMKVNGMCVPSFTPWSGWLPINSVDIVGLL